MVAKKTQRLLSKAITVSHLHARQSLMIMLENPMIIAVGANKHQNKF
jgi:hypothetical protein